MIRVMSSGRLEYVVDFVASADYGGEREALPVSRARPKNEGEDDYAW